MNRVLVSRGIVHKGLLGAFAGSLLLFAACKPAGESAPESESQTQAGPVSEADIKGLAKFRDAFLAVKTADELEAFLQGLETNYASAPPEVKLASSYALLVRPFRSVVFRAAPLFKQNNATHSLVLTGVQQMVASTSILLPTTQWKAVTAYFTEPSTSKPNSFKSVADAQSEVETIVIPLLEKTIKNVTAIDVSDANPVVWDHRIAYGTASFKDPRDRFTKIGLAEKYAGLATLNSYLTTARVVSAYDINDAVAVIGSLGKIFGVDGFLLSSVQGAPISLRVSAINEYPQFLTIKSNGKALMAAALQSVRASIEAGSKTYEAVAARQASLGGKVDEFWALRPDVIMTGTRGISLTLKESSAIVSGPAQIYSNLTNESVAVNVPEFFTNPPADAKAFFPTSFVQGEDVSINGVKARNYLYGSATAWNVSAWSPYITSLKSSADVKEAARILGQSWGGGFVAAALAPFVF